MSDGSGEPSNSPKPLTMSSVKPLKPKPYAKPQVLIEWDTPAFNAVNRGVVIEPTGGPVQGLGVWGLGFRV